MSAPSIAERLALPPLTPIAGADPEAAIIDTYKIAIANLCAPAFGISAEKIYPGVDNGKRGDFAVAIARFRLGGRPADWGQRVVDSFQPDQYVTECILDGAFLYFTINQETFTYNLLSQINKYTKAAKASSNKPGSAFVPGYGSNKIGQGKRMLIDFSSPNIAKPIHAGHLRSTIIGAFISNVHEACGWNVTRMNYLGDWGTQYGLLSVGYSRYGNEEDLLADPIQHLYEVYVKVNKVKAEENEALEKEHAAKGGEGYAAPGPTTVESRAVFKAMEDGDPAALEQWTRFRELSIEKLKETYARLNIHFDLYHGESKVKNENIDRAMRIMEEKGMLCEDRGALLADLTKFKMDRAIVRKGDGTSIYLTRDIAGAYERFMDHKFDKHIYVVASQQTLHFKQLFKILELMGEEFADKLSHISYGMVTGMSTRKGTVVFLNDILEEAKAKMHEQMRVNEEKYAQIEDPEMTSDVIGVTAVKIQDMKGKRVLDYEFDWARCTSFEGDFGPYIQYSHVRLCSVERKNPNVILPENRDEIDTTLLTEDKCRILIKQLAAYPAVVKVAYENSEPSKIVEWCFRTSHLVSQAWETIKVSGQEEELAKARLYLFISTRDVLSSAMKLLSLTPLERM